MTLVIDFGAVNTVAMLDGRLVTVDGAPWLPTLVHEGVVGADAAALAGGRVARDLKERLDPDEVRALFARVLAAARDQGGVVGSVLVTHPAGWPRERVAVLLSAAGTWARAVPEPVAVAAGHGAEDGTVLVVDAGGGTWDVAAVRGQTVVTAATLPFGGNDVDRLIVDRVRPSLRSVAEEGALLESARVGKEVLSRHESTEIVLPDHRAVRLDRAEFERMLAADVARLLGLVSEVASRAGARRVLLVGGSSRIPLLSRRLAEAGLPVTTDPEPETAVVRGAQLLPRPPMAEDPPASAVGSPAAASPPGHATPTGSDSVAVPEAGVVAGSAAALGSALAPGQGAAPASAPGSSPNPGATPESAGPGASRPGPQPNRRPAPGRGPLAIAIVLLLVAAVAVVFGGARPTSGRAVAADTPPLPEAIIPPAVAGNEVVNGELATFTAAALGEPVEYQHPSGNLLMVTVTGVETVVTAPRPYREAPDGFRWLVLRLSVINVSGPDFPDDPMTNVAVLDDRGQWLRQPDGGGRFACADGVPPATRIPVNAQVDVCGVTAVPDATPVTAVLFGVRSPGAQPPLRFPVDVPAHRDRAAPTHVVGTVGGPAVTVDGLRARVDLVRTPSGYLADQVPSPGHRFVVVRVAVTATSRRHVSVVLRDDRGALLSGRAGRLRDCPPLTGDLAPETPVYGCHVFEVAAATPVAAVSLVGRTLDAIRWPTWRAG